MIRFKTMEDGWYQKALATLINGVQRSIGPV